MSLSEGHRRRRRRRRHRLIETFLSNEKTADGDRSRRRRRNELLGRGIAAVAETAETAAAAGDVAPGRSSPPVPAFAPRARALGHACFWTDAVDRQGLAVGALNCPPNSSSSSLNAGDQLGFTVRLSENFTIGPMMMSLFTLADPVTDRALLCSGPVVLACKWALHHRPQPDT